MKRRLLNSKAFTLVELIIVIAIIAILAVSAGLMLTKWMWKSKDARLLSDLVTIDKAIQVTYADKMSYPTPDIGDKWGDITVSWVNYNFTQGVLNDAVVAKMSDLDRTPKTTSGGYYYYSLWNDNKYQLAWQKQDLTWVVRWSYNYIAVASWTVWTADVAELPSLFVLSGGALSGTTTLASGGKYTFIIDWRKEKEINPYHYASGIKVDDDTVIDNLYKNNLNYTGWISSGVLQAQLKEQLGK